ncbi:hypothetical protein [Singulisphaera sp. PoT]|uniref:hypothetical protein n=1 Tax=Singulisphaera sp. PoT TaxID=3411797 RepID=UPI003BF54252
MAERMVGIRVSILRYVADEPQPGLVQCEFVDAHGRRLTFTEKTAIVSDEYLDSRSQYPRPGAIICKVIGRRRDSSEREVVEVSTEYFPDGDDSPGNTVNLEVFAESLVEWEWGSPIDYDA